MTRAATREDRDHQGGAQVRCGRQSAIRAERAKDAELIATEQVRGATWHFFQGPVTGHGGPSAPLRQALEQAGIGIVIH